MIRRLRRFLPKSHDWDSSGPDVRPMAEKPADRRMERLRTNHGLLTDAPWDVEILWPAMQPRETTMPRPVVFRERETK